VLQVGKIMNGKQTALMAVVGMALLATVVTASSPAPALALSHLNLDRNITPISDIANEGIDRSGTDEEEGAEEENNADDEDRMTATTDDGIEEEDSEDGNDNSNAEAHIAYEELLRCLLNIEAETEEEVQACIESSYGEMDSSENANDSEDGDEDEEGDGDGDGDEDREGDGD
jgi:hypothetical protein